MLKLLRSTGRRKSPFIQSNPSHMAKKLPMTISSLSKTKKFCASVGPRAAGNISINSSVSTLRRTLLLYLLGRLMNYQIFRCFSENIVDAFALMIDGFIISPKYFSKSDLTHKLKMDLEIVNIINYQYTRVSRNLTQTIYFIRPVGKILKVGEARPPKIGEARV